MFQGIVLRHGMAVVFSNRGETHMDERTPNSSAHDTPASRSWRHKGLTLGVAASLAVGVSLGSAATARAATSCSTLKSASWGKGWACYNYNSAGERVRVYGALEDVLTDGYCISFAMRSANEIRDALGDGYNWRHHNVACTNFKAVSFNYDITGVDYTPGVLWDSVAVATREKADGTVVSFLTIDTASCRPQCQSVPG